MTTFDYTRTRATAERLIARFGQTGTIRRTTSTGPEWDPTQTVADYACIFAVMDYDKRDVDGTLIRQTDRKVYLSTAVLALTPETSDSLVAGGVPYSIIDVKPLSPAGTVVYYEVQARL